MNWTDAHTEKYTSYIQNREKTGVNLRIPYKRLTMVEKDDSKTNSLIIQRKKWVSFYNQNKKLLVASLQ